MNRDEARVHANRMASEFNVPMCIVAYEFHLEVRYAVCSQYETAKHGFEYAVVETVGLTEKK